MGLFLYQSILIKFTLLYQLLVEYKGILDLLEKM